MNNRNTPVPAVLVATAFVLLAGCTGMNSGETAMQAAPVPPPPGETAGTTRQDKQDKQNTKTQKGDLPDRVFAPLDNTVNDINRDINREIDKEYPANKSSE
jgi:hypothetical protein